MTTQTAPAYSAQPTQNHLLAALDPNENICILSSLERVFLPLGEVLYEAGGRITHAFFPVDCVVANVYETNTGNTGESLIVGNDGMLGVELVMPSQTATARTVVVSKGLAYRAPAKVVTAQSHLYGDFFALGLRYLQVALTQVMQTAACNRYHSIDQQLCRWLLLVLDRVPNDELTITHELIANMLGVRRESITSAAAKLQSRGVISYSRGHISVLNRAVLEQLSCECYAVVKNEANRLLPYCAARPTIKTVTSRHYEQAAAPRNISPDMRQVAPPKLHSPHVAARNPPAFPKTSLAS